MAQNILDRPRIVWQGGATITNSGSPAPVSSGFFMPPAREVVSPVGRVNRAEYKTRKGNKPSRLFAVVETRRLINAAKRLNEQEAQS